VLASLLPPPSAFALLHDVPAAALAVLDRAQAREDVAAPALLAAAAAEALALLACRGTAALDRRDHGALLRALPQLLGAAPRARAFGIALRRLCAAPEPENAGEAPPWAAALLFRALRAARMAEEGCMGAVGALEDALAPLEAALEEVGNEVAVEGEEDDVDVEVERLMRAYVRGLSLQGLRDFQSEEVAAFRAVPKTDEGKNAVTQAIALAFIRSNSLQRNLDGVSLLEELGVTAEWLVAHDVLENLLGGSSVHSELCRRSEGIVSCLASENLLSRENLRLLWSVSGDLFRVAVEIIRNTGTLAWILSEIGAKARLGGPKFHDAVTVIQTISERPDVSGAVAEQGILLMWELQHAEGVAGATVAHANDGEGLLGHVVQLCLNALNRDASFFAHLVLDLIWEKIPPLGELFHDNGHNLEDSWIEALETCFQTLPDAREPPEVHRAFELGSRILMNKSMPAKMEDFIFQIWDLSVPYLGSQHERTPCSQVVSDAFFEWLAQLLHEEEMLSAHIGFSFFETRVYEFIELEEQSNCPLIYELPFFEFFLSLFVLMNTDNLRNLLEDPSERLSFQNLKYVVPKCDPGELLGVEHLWRIAIYTSEDRVGRRAITVLQGLYDPSLDPENPNVLRVRKDYVGKCINILDEVKDSEVGPTQRCLGFVEALLNEAEAHGTRGYRSHGARQRGHIHSLSLFDQQNPEVNFEVTMYSNATVWDVRCAVASRHSPPCQATRVALRWLEQEGTLLEDSDNSTTLADLGFSGNETLTFWLADEFEAFEMSPRVRLLDVEGDHLTPLAGAALETVFEDWASDRDRNGDLRMSVDDFVRLFTHCTGAINMKAVRRRVNDVYEKWGSFIDETTGERFLLKDDFLAFYEQAAQTRPMSVWKDLLKQGFDNKLQRQPFEDAKGRLTSEFRLSFFKQFGDDDAANSSSSQRENPDIHWRAILANESGLYNALFHLLKSPNKSVVQTSWSSLLRLPTSQAMLGALRNIGTADLSKLLSLDSESPLLVQYTLHIIVSFMEEEESKELLGATIPNSTQMVEQHFQWARRASFEPPSTVLTTKTAHAWTENFLSHGGLDHLNSLIDSSMKSLESRSSLPDTLEDVLELALKAIKLAFTCTKFGSSTSLLGRMDQETQSHFIQRVTPILDAFLDGKIVSLNTAEYALFLWDFYFSWLYKMQPADTLQKDLDTVPTIKLSYVRNSESGIGGHSEASYTRRVWEDACLESICRVCKRFHVMRDKFLEDLCKIQLHFADGLSEWLTALTVELVNIKTPKSNFLPSSDQFDPRLLDSVVRDLFSNRTEHSKLLTAMIEVDRESTLAALEETEFKLHELVTQLSHLLRSSYCPYRHDMMELLKRICFKNEKFSFSVGESMILPVLRSRDPAVTKELSQSESLARKDLKVGLVNLFNTCYLNSLLQLLVSFDPLLEIIFEHNPSASDENMWFNELQRTLSFLLLSERKAFEPVEFVKAMSIDVKVQEDVEEMMGVLFEMIGEIACNENVWDRCFGGRFNVQQICEACGKRSVRIINSGTRVALEIAERQNIADSMSRSEVLSDFECDSCRTRGRIVQHKTWERVPNILVFHLKRFTFDYNANVRRKILTPFRFEVEIYERDIAGIICHQGYAEKGHYYAYIRDEGDAWFEINDNIVRRIDGFPTEAYQSAYILCYLPKRSAVDLEQSRLAVLESIPQHLKSEVAADNLALELGSTLQDEAFWDLTSTVLHTVPSFSATATTTKKENEEKRKKKKGRRRSSLSAAPKPSWWPDAGDKTESVHFRGDRDEEEEVIVLTGLQYSLAVSVFRFLAVNSAIVLEGEVKKRMFDVLLEMSSENDVFPVKLTEICVMLAKSFPLSSELFYFVSHLLDQSEDVPSVRTMLMKESHFLEAALATFERADASSRSIIAKSVQKCASSDELELLDEVFSTIDSTILESFCLESCAALPAHQFLHFMDLLSSGSVGVARSIIEALARSAGPVELEPVLKALLQKRDAFAQERMKSFVLECAEPLHKFLAVIESRTEGVVILKTLAAPGGIVIVCDNPTPDDAIVKFWFTVKQDSESFKIPTLDKVISRKVPGDSQSNKLFFAERIGDGTTTCTFDVSVTQLVPLRIITDEIDVDENDEMRVTFSDQQENKSNNVGTLTEDAFAHKVKAIQSMGFQDVFAIQEALRKARGNEGIALEYLLN